MMIMHRIILIFLSIYLLSSCKSYNIRYEIDSASHERAGFFPEVIANDETILIRVKTTLDGTKPVDAYYQNLMTNKI
jgi:hypothetical protein